MYDNNGSHRSSDLFRLVKPFLALHFLIYIIATFFLDFRCFFKFYSSMSPTTWLLYNKLLSFALGYLVVDSFEQ
jgi:hypothetical protein